MFTRKNYLAATLEDQPVAHRKFYSQFVTEKIKTIVAKGIRIGAIQVSTDRHFNDIPLERWDRLANLYQHLLWAKDEEDAKKMYSLACGVCILKEAAKRIKEEQETKS